MISAAAVMLQLRRLTAEDLARWVEARWVLAQGPPGAWMFQAIDVARIRLILELREELEIEERSLPVVLGLLDQLYALRRREARLHTALAAAPPEMARKFKEILEEE